MRVARLWFAALLLIAVYAFGLSWQVAHRVDWTRTLREHVRPLRNGSMISPDVLRGCSHVYLDVGTNIGVQIRKLFEPEKYEGSPMIDVFARWFPANVRDRVCVVGFEPNPEHAARLDFLEWCYVDKMGLRVVVLRDAVHAGADGATLHFETRSVRPNSDDTRISDTGNMNVTAVNFEAFVRDVVLADKREFVGAKFDVEGAEYDVLSSLGPLTNALNAATVEWHHTPSRVEELRVRGALALSAPQIMSMDDETFASDGMPWPPECKTA